MVQHAIAGLPRTLAAHEVPLIAAHLADLGATGRFERFGHTMSQEALTIYAIGFASGDRVGLGVNNGTRLIGLGDLSRCAGTESDFELAVSVVPSHQGRGVGRQIVQAALAFAEDRKISRLALYCSRDNQRARRLGLYVSRTPIDLGSLMLFEADRTARAAHRHLMAGIASRDLI